MPLYVDRRPTPATASNATPPLSRAPAAVAINKLLHSAPERTQARVFCRTAGMRALQTGGVRW